MSETTAFVLFDLLHLAILASVALISAIFIKLYRMNSSRRMDLTLSILLIFFLIGSKVLEMIVIWKKGYLTLQNSLQMHLCDWSAFLVVILLIFRIRFLYEVLYFWAATGALQALLTPDHGLLFSGWRMVSFFVSHGAIVIAVAYLTWGHKMRPTKVSIFKAFAFTQFYLLCAGLVNWLLNCNYGYLCAKPESATLLDYLGPWPWYILTGDIVVLILFGFVYLPFAWLDRSARQRNYGSCQEARFS